jgi:hypothetical protein
MLKLIKNYAMRMCGGVDVEIKVHLTWTLVEREWSASYFGLFIPGKRSPNTHLIGDLVGPRAGLDSVKIRKCLTLPGLELSSHARLARRQSLYRLRL